MPSFNYKMHTPKPEPLGHPYHAAIYRRSGELVARCFPTLTGTRAELLERAQRLANIYSGEVREHGTLY